MLLRDEDTPLSVDGKFLGVAEKEALELQRLVGGRKRLDLLVVRRPLVHWVDGKGTVAADRAADDLADLGTELRRHDEPSFAVYAIVRASQEHGRFPHFLPLSTTAKEITPFFLHRQGLKIALKL